ncbi:hypothetical protein CEXT_802201 [Caerostris extrusa]|uniref:LAGLIDADG homing endonuclease n=1 Tax=Caerostris extrusa TaxID=172846 RepID=A0AAV4NVV1_CAEEX|nr:hypothetical protein CEXT_802201 [Caerostris extrusa]
MTRTELQQLIAAGNVRDGNFAKKSLPPKIASVDRTMLTRMGIIQNERWKFYLVMMQMQIFIQTRISRDKKNLFVDAKKNSICLKCNLQQNRLNDGVILKTSFKPHTIRYANLIMAVRELTMLCRDLSEENIG